jgi:FAD/FMN-containing dehydrogenase
MPEAVRAAVGLATLPIPPAVVELLDTAALEASGIQSASRRGAALLALVAGADPSEVDARSIALSARLAPAGGNPRLLGESEASAAWAARRALPDALAHRWPGHATVEVGIPLDRVEAYVGAARRLATEADARIAIYGSVGLGSLTVMVDPHPSPFAEHSLEPFASLKGELREGLRAGSLPEGEGARRPHLLSAESVLESVDSTLARALVASARSLGGQPLDATGLGLDYGDWQEVVMPPSSIAAFRRVRAALDPSGTLRPART